MKRENNFRLSNYRFIEVGLLVNGFEFYHEFCIPVNLSMRRFNDKAKKFDPVPVEDWLVMDFPTILRRKLFALNPSCSIEVHSIRNILPHQRALAPIVRGDSLPQTWCDTFIYLIASYFANNFHYDEKELTI